MVGAYLVPGLKATGLPAGPSLEDEDAYHGGGAGPALSRA